MVYDLEKFKVGDKVRVKSLDEVLEIEGETSIGEVESPGINPDMVHMFGDTATINNTHDSGNFYVRTDDDDYWTLKPEWLETYDELDELVRYTEELDLLIEIGDSRMLITSDNHLILVGISLDNPLTMDLYYHTITLGQMMKLIELSLEYSKTLVKKYYLRLPDGYNLTSKYLNYDAEFDEYLFSDKEETHEYQTKFTQEEIEDFPEQNFVKTLIKEEVK